MRVRNTADYRTLVWTLILFPLVPVVDYWVPSAAYWLLPVGLYLAYCAGVITHNHNHCPVFESRRANKAYSAWLSFFYGAPIFTWIPTHNQNHHRFVDGLGDATRTSRYSPRHTLWHAITYPFLSAYWQLPLIRAYVKQARQTNPARMRLIVLQYVALVGGHLAALALALFLHGWALGAVTYALALGIPALFATWAMMFTNYVQHVHCNPESEHDHSRNFVSPWVNWFVFDAGYHTVHHENPGTHWSSYRAMHRRRANQIDPRLNEHSILTFCVKNYLLGPIWRGLRTTPIDHPGGPEVRHAS